VRVMGLDWDLGCDLDVYMTDRKRVKRLIMTWRGITALCSSCPVRWKGVCYDTRLGLYTRTQGPVNIRRAMNKRTNEWNGICGEFTSADLWNSSLSAASYGDGGDVRALLVLVVMVMVRVVMLTLAEAIERDGVKVLGGAVCIDWCVDIDALRGLSRISEMKFSRRCLGRS
jgi:hypothetical protein